MMIKEVGIFEFETYISGGKIDKSIIELLKDAGYSIQKLTDRKYRVFMEEEENGDGNSGIGNNDNNSEGVDDDI